MGGVVQDPLLKALFIPAGGFCVHRVQNFVGDGDRKTLSWRSVRTFR